MKAVTVNGTLHSWGRSTFSVAGGIQPMHVTMDGCHRDTPPSHPESQISSNDRGRFAAAVVYNASKAVVSAFTEGKDVALLQGGKRE